MMEIQKLEPTRSICECCNGKATHLTRFIHLDNNTIGMYYARFSDNHPENHLAGILSLGDWSTTHVNTERIAFAFKIWTYDGTFQAGITDKDESPWKDLEVLGTILDRQEALSHPSIDKVFYITDFMVEGDEPVVEFFRQARSSVS
jgi:hypothetical protein